MVPTFEYRKCIKNANPIKITPKQILKLKGDWDKL